ncbi:MAG: phage portal protein, partial [bacterium]|nr:phage portal protein [bacterium]
GYRVNAWVYRAVNLAAKTVASVPWGVVGEDEKRLENHPLDILLRHPNPHISRQDLFELWVAWLELAGNATALKVKAAGKTSELWPISPDRVHPIPSKDIAQWLKGYSLDNNTALKWEPQELLHFKYFDPADPYWGMSPLQACSKTVDIDTDQRNWNKSAMQNMGVLSGVFTFKREFDNQDQADAVAEKLNARYASPGNARRLGVLGSEAKYTRIGATPQELDFGNSRTANMNEIFITFGTPPQYAGSQEQSTYNNYQTSELIYWFQKIIPLLDDLKDTFNFSFQDELEPGQEITYFLNNIPAIRRAMLERAKTAHILYTMGVPFNKLNNVFKFDVEEFEGWDISNPGTKAPADANVRSREVRSEIIHHNISPLAKRDMSKEAKAREDWASKRAKKVEVLLGDQQEIIFNAIDTGGVKINPKKLLRDTWESDWAPVYNDIIMGYALIAADQIVVSKRAKGLEDMLAAYFEDEAIVLRELSEIEQSTVDAIILQTKNALAEGMSTAQLQTALIDAGIFSPERALRLARTITGTAGSIGQYISAKETGVTHKKWIDSGFAVRDEHMERASEPAVKIDSRFQPKFGATTGPMYPLDPNMPAADKINCRCSMTFQIKD